MLKQTVRVLMSIVLTTMLAGANLFAQNLFDYGKLHFTTAEHNRIIRLNKRAMEENAKKPEDDPLANNAAAYSTLLRLITTNGTQLSEKSTKIYLTTIGIEVNDFDKLIEVANCIDKLS